MTRQRWVWGLVLGLVAWGAWNRREVRRLEQALESLQTVAEPEAVAPVSAPVESGASDRLALEVAGLRSEMASLRRWVQEQFPAVEAGASTGRVQPSSAGAREKAPVLPAHVRNGWVDASGIPQAVLDGFRRQLGDTPIEGAHVKQSEGRFFFSLESKTAEGRHMELSLDQSGQVVRSHVEMDLAALPEALQGTVLQSLGDIPARRVAAVFEDGKTVYRVQAKASDHAVEMVLSPEGQVLRSETRFRDKKP